MSLSVGAPTAGVLPIVGAVVIGTVVDGEFEEYSGGGTGTVTSVSITTANGVSGSVATATTTPAITLTLGAITPTSLAVGGGGVAAFIQTGTASVVDQSIGSGSYFSKDITVTGALAGDACFVSLGAALSSGIIYTGCFSGTDVVTAVFYNTDLVLSELLSATLRATAIRFA